MIEHIKHIFFRMMEKMGWQGGALGKNGEGIIEPITPNASYVSVNM